MLAPPEGLRAPGVPGVNPGVDPGSQGVIPRRFKRKKIFVTNVVGAGWTHRREGGNSGLDLPGLETVKRMRRADITVIF